MQCQVCLKWKNPYSIRHNIEEVSYSDGSIRVRNFVCIDCAKWLDVRRSVYYQLHNYFQANEHRLIQLQQEHQFDANGV